MYCQFAMERRWLLLSERGEVTVGGEKAGSGQPEKERETQSLGVNAEK